MIALEAEGAIYIALAVALSVWIGVFVYLWRIDGQARKLAAKLDELPPIDERAQPSATLRRQSPDSEPSSTVPPQQVAERSS